MDEESIEVAAPPETVWALVTDITQMGRWSPECTTCRWLAGATGPAVGARFKGTNRHGLVQWRNTSTVTKATEHREFEWQVRQSGMLWGYRFEPSADGGTRITEYRDHTQQAPLYVRLVQRSGLIGRDRQGLMVEGMRETLRRLKAAAEA